MAECCDLKINLIIFKSVQTNAQQEKAKEVSSE